MTLEHFDTILAFVLIITGVSLLITALNQAASAALGLRGTQLRWAIQTLLASVDPSLKDHARQIAQRALGHQLISDSTFSKFGSRLFDRFRLANAISLDELKDSLRHLAASPPTSGNAAPTPAWVAAHAALRQSLEDLDPQAAQDLEQVATKVRELFPNDAAKAEKLIAPLLDSAATLPAKIDRWFDSVMARSSQRFTLYMRICTVICAVIVAFALQLDTFVLFTRLSNDAQVRAQVLASADAVIRRADESTSSSTNGSPATYVTAMRQLISDHTNELKGLSQPGGFSTIEGATNWLAGQLTRLNIADPGGKWQQAYVDLVPEARLRAATDNLNSLLNEKFISQLVPQPYPDPFYKDWSPKCRHFWGILATVALLSMGTPAWFNILKNLSNLRPTLANQADEKKEGGKDKRE